MRNIPGIMKAILTMGNGGYEKLSYCDIPTPAAQKGDVLIEVKAAGINNTDINTRIGWYSSSVIEATDSTRKQQETKSKEVKDGGWRSTTPFPLIQGTDCCGIVVAAPAESDRSLLGKRVLVRPCTRPNGFQELNTQWMASDFNGAFAQFVKVPVSEVFPINSEWKDAELASIPCAYGTAENMLHRALVSQKDTVLITGASGGVGVAAIQLAKRRGATVLAVSSGAKKTLVKDLGADRVFDRQDDILTLLGAESVDVVVDNVAGDGFPPRIKLLKRGGRYVSSGAISGPIVSLDMRDFYLKDITFIGCTAWDEPVFSNLVSYIEHNQITPVVAKVFDLKEIETAQREFLQKDHVGKFVLIPPPVKDP